MSNPAPDPEPTPAAEAQADLDVRRAEGRLRALEELREIGMELVRSLRDRVPAGEGSAASEAKSEVTGEDAAAAKDSGARSAKDLDPAEAFWRLSRALRLTVALEAGADEALRDLRAGVHKVREEKRAKAAEEAHAAAVEARDDRQLRIRSLVGMAAERQITDPKMLDRLDMDVNERLANSEAYWIDPARPLRDIVEHICRCFGVTPDWSRWNGEGWIEDDQPPWPWAPSPLAVDNIYPWMPVPRYKGITFSDYTDPTFKLPDLE